MWILTRALSFIQSFLEQILGVYLIVVPIHSCNSAGEMFESSKFRIHSQQLSAILNYPTRNFIRATTGT
jgi:hypothetical protein